MFTTWLVALVSMVVLLVVVAYAAYLAERERRYEDARKGRQAKDDAVPRRKAGKPNEVSKRAA